MAATGFEFFARDLAVATKATEPEAMRLELAAFARRERDALISSGRASPVYDTYVNGQHGAREETVVLPGPIMYVFANWKLVVETALEELKKRVPRKTGRYAASFLVTVNGRVVTDFQTIAPDATVKIINAQPYTRKMEVGGNKTGKRHFELAKSAVNRRFSGAFSATTEFSSAAGGIDPRVPYILRRANGRRKDSKAGMPITYPTLVLTSS